MNNRFISFTYFLKKIFFAYFISALVYSLATVETVVPPSEVGAMAGVKPRARTVVHRSFLTLNSQKNAGGACILETTTDIRSSKCRQFIQNRSAAEVLWWFPESESQFRLQCRPFVLPALSHEWRREFPTDLTGEALGELDWEAARVESFNRLSPSLRASFARPAPGSELVEREKARDWPKELSKLGQESEEEKEMVRWAFENFAVLYLEVEEVDFVDLGVLPNERCRYVFQAGEWLKSVLVP